MISVHPIPETLDAWLSGWRESKRTGNPYLKLGNDMYVVFPAKRGEGWCASIGKSFASGRCPDADTAKRSLYDYVRGLDPDELAALHAGDGEPPPPPSRPQSAPAPSRPSTRPPANDSRDVVQIVADALRMAADQIEATRRS
jgi:hypothetical protein